MHNYSPEQKPYYSALSQNNIEVEETNYDQMQLQSTGRIVKGLSEKISQIMMPFYDGFKSQYQSGKVFGTYPVLKYPLAPQRNFITQSGVNFQQLANRVRESQKMEYQVMNQKKIHQLLDQHEARSMYDDESPDQGYGQRYKMGRRHYQKLAREMKTNKKLKRRFKDKNRPKKAKSAYNLFVQEVVPQIKAENPSFSAPDLVRVAARMYNKLSDDEKVPYQRKYLIDKERFEREREAYFRQHPEMDYRMDAKQKASYMNDKYMHF